MSPILAIWIACTFTAICLAIINSDLRIAPYEWGQGRKKRALALIIMPCLFAPGYLLILLGEAIYNATTNRPTSSV